MTQLGAGRELALDQCLTPKHLFWPPCPQGPWLGRCRQGEGGALPLTPPIAALCARTLSWLGLQSASQPRLSYAEMAEDYPRYPDIHDLDLTLLNPRMIVVRRAARQAPGDQTVLVRAGPRWLASHPGEGSTGYSSLELSCLCRMSPHT